MSKLWKYFKNLLHAAETSSSQQPLLHELIQRSEAEKSAYKRWKRSLVCRRLCDWLHHQYATYQAGPERLDEAIDFLETPSAKGFVIHFRCMQYNRQDCLFFFDFLKEKVLAQAYRTYVSDTRTYTRNQWVENIQRHYLKPQRPKQPEPGRQNQQYGNINIELLSRNDQVWNLKFSATSYRDRMFLDPEEFSVLIDELVNE